MMPEWTLDFTQTALKALKKIHPQEAQRLLSFLKERVVKQPRQLGKPLKGDLDMFWRYRVGDYRIIADLEDQLLIINVVAINHRKDIYKH